MNLDLSQLVPEAGPGTLTLNSGRVADPGSRVSLNVGQPSAGDIGLRINQAKSNTDDRRETKEKIRTPAPDVLPRCSAMHVSRSRQL